MLPLLTSLPPTPFSLLLLLMPLLPLLPLPLLLPQLSDRQDERDEQLNEVISNYADSWKLKDKQVHAVTSSKGDKKVKAMASAVRAMLFMQRYESELRQREDKLLVSGFGGDEGAGW